MLKNLRASWGTRWSHTKDRGATAVVIALTMVLILGAAAVSFDTGNLALQRQTLRNITDAAAQAGASYLPDDPTGAMNAAIAYAHKSDPSLNPTLSMWCIVASTGASKQVAIGQIPATCDPGGSGVYLNGAGGVVCNESLCAIPCQHQAAGAKCNSMRVAGQKDVPYYFAPAIGIDSGTTGAVSSTSCRGSCGTLLPNAMDVAFVADRTTSLDPTVFASMQSGIAATLTAMTPEYQFVTLGTIHKSQTVGNCKTALPAYGTSPTAPDAARDGNWMPLGFSNNYLTGSLGSPTRAVDPSSELVKNINCMNQAGQPWGTHLAAPLKSAARALLGYQVNGQPNNLNSLSAARAALLPPATVVKKAIIMETDGVPEESIAYNGTIGTQYVSTNTSLGSTSLTNASDPVSGSPWFGDVGCTNFSAVATEAKKAGITVIMIGYGLANTAKCKRDYSTNTYSGANVKDVLAGAASDAPNGGHSTANTDCATTAGADLENADGDFYFCAANGAQLAQIFATAISQISSTTKFVKMPTTT